MKKSTLLLLFYIFSFSLSYGQSWFWGAEAKYQCCEGNYGASADNKGDVYLTGNFEDSISFGHISLISGLPSIYLAKYDSSGNILWVNQSITPSLHCGATGYSVTCDGSDNTYVCGNFGNGILVLGADSLNNSSVYGDVFLMKSDPNGNVLWAKQATTTPGSPSGGRAMSIISDNTGHVYITGYFIDSISFGSTPELTGSSIFLVKYDTLGNVILAKQAKNLNQGQIGSNSVAVDHFGNIYITGYFSDTIYFGATILTTDSRYGDLFLAKYSSAGNLLWAIQSYTIPDTDYTHGVSVISDANGNVYVTGVYTGQTTFGVDTLRTSYHNSEAFLVKYDSMGNVLWLKSSECNYGAQGYSLAINSNSQIYLSASAGYTRSASISFCGDSLNLNNSFDPAIILKLDTGGNTLCGSIIRTGGTSQNTVTCSANGKYIYLGGDQMDSITFNTDNLPLTGRLGSAPFVARWNPCGIATGIGKINTLHYATQIFPNPNNGQFIIQARSQESGGKSNIEIYNMLGENVYSNPFINSKSSISLPNQPNGIYLYRIVNQDGVLVGVGKFIIEK